MADLAPAAPEFSRPIDLSRIGGGETTQNISATPEECKALARRFGLIDLGRLAARVALRRTRGGTGLRLSAHFEAEVTQACVVTLEPVQSRIAKDFTTLYARSDSGPPGADADVIIDPEGDSVVEPWPDGQLDIGETVAQELAVSLDPYPHAPGAALESAWRAEPAAEVAAKPFAPLAKLKQKKEKQ